MGLSLLFHQNEAAQQLQKESDKRIGLWQQSLADYGRFRNEQDAALRGGENLYREAAGNIDTGFAAALRAASLTGRASRTAAKEQGVRNQAALQQSMVSRGLYGTTALDNGRRGVSSDTARRLQEIDDSIAGITGQLEVGRGQALAQSKIGQAGFTANASALRQNSTEQYINLLRDRPKAFNKALFRGAVGTQVSGEFASWFGGFMGGHGYGSTTYQNQGQGG